MSDQPPENPTQPPPANPYQPYQAPGAYPAFVQDHPQATTVLVLGILGISMCQLVAPFAWVMGSRVKREIDANPMQYGGRQMVQIGHVLGIVGSVMLAFAVGILVIYFGIVVAVIGAGL